MLTSSSVLRDMLEDNEQQDDIVVDLPGIWSETLSCLSRYLATRETDSWVMRSRWHNRLFDVMELCERYDMPIIATEMLKQEVEDLSGADICQGFIWASKLDSIEAAIAILMRGDVAWADPYAQFPGSPSFGREMACQLRPDWVWAIYHSAEYMRFNPVDWEGVQEESREYWHRFVGKFLEGLRR